MKRNEMKKRGKMKGAGKKKKLKLFATATLPTRFGNFRVAAFPDGKEEHIALIKGDVGGKRNVLVRIHSQCLTGDVFGSLRCDCRDQLEKALSLIGSGRKGVLLYLRQEGRGIGLSNKIKAYRLQEGGYDTVEANKRLGFEADMRSYRIAASILKELDVRSVLLLTNNPKKIADLNLNGIKISKRIPLIAKAGKYNRSYLKTKRTKLGHML